MEVITTLLGGALAVVGGMAASWIKDNRDSRQRQADDAQRMCAAFLAACDVLAAEAKKAQRTRSVNALDGDLVAAVKGALKGEEPEALEAARMDAESALGQMQLAHPRLATEAEALVAAAGCLTRGSPGTLAQAAFQETRRRYVSKCLKYLEKLA